MSESTRATLTGQTAVVTGSSGGIGSAMARHLAEAGATVIVHANSRRAAAERLVQSIVDGGGHGHVVTADLARAANIDQLIHDCWQLAGHVDIWINNAGADVLTGGASEASFAEKLERLWHVDVCGTIYASRMIGRRMLDRGGVILNMGWDQAETGMAGDSGEMFAATKGAVMAFTRSLAKTFAPRVRVNCLAPGWIKTEWGEEAAPYWNQRAHQEALRGRWGTPTDVARAAVFLCSPAADFVTGQIIAINGGLAGYDQWCPPPPSSSTADDSP